MWEEILNNLPEANSKTGLLLYTFVVYMAMFILGCMFGKTETKSELAANEKTQVKADAKEASGEEELEKLKG